MVNLSIVSSWKISSIVFLSSVFIACGGGDESASSLSLVVTLQTPDVTVAGGCSPILLRSLDSSNGDPIHVALSIPVKMRADTGTFFADAACSHMQSEFEWSAAVSEMQVYYLANQEGMVRMQAQGDKIVSEEQRIQVVAPGYKQSLSSQALIVYNQNAVGAQEIAEYYAKARQIPQEQMCAVTLPPGLYGSPAELWGARKTIVESCICSALVPDIRPDPCKVENIAAIAQVSPFTHLVIIRGMPARLIGGPWPEHVEDPSFDYYLAHFVYNDDRDEVFVREGNPRAAPQYPAFHADRRYVSPLNAAVHRSMAYGRIEAMTVDRTKDLIDRTLAAERAGFSGNIFAGTDNEFARRLVSATSDPCREYLENPGELWPQECRFGTTAHRNSLGKSHLPGEQESPIPVAVNAGVLLGSSYRSQTQSGFDGFDVMRRWHKSEMECVELCSDFPSVAERRECRARSTDYFSELNTECVGTANGFWGHQVRSWVVQYYGFMPVGWDTVGNGQVEKIPPTIVRGESPEFNYAHFGSRCHPLVDADCVLETPRCTRETGDIRDCPERIAVALESNLDESTFPLVVPRDGKRDFRVSFRYRYPGPPGAKLQVGLLVTYASGKRPRLLTDIELSVASGDWREASAIVSVGPDGDNLESDTKIIRARFLISVTVKHGVYEYLDLGRFRVEDVLTEQSLLPEVVGNFAMPAQNDTHAGDWAANVIDRLGGIACFGSSSHFLTNGFAFSDSFRQLAMLSSGRSLGEMLVSRTAVSGIIYGDPLYRPMAVKIFTGMDFDEIGTTEHVPGLLPRVGPGDFEDGRAIRINAMNGVDYREDIEWEVSVCLSPDWEACDKENMWKIALRGQGAVEELPIDLRDQLEGEGEKTVSIRLQAFQSGAGNGPIRNYARILYNSNGFDCEGDVDQDGYVTSQDRRLVHLVLPCGLLAPPPIVDCDGNPGVGIEDQQCFAEQLRAQNPATDLTRDGLLDDRDLQAFEDLYCGGNNDTLDADINRDGKVNRLDIKLIDANMGACP